MNNIISKSVQKGYPAAVAAPCILGGKLYCLRNDVAPDVLWYNAKLMKQWGYKVPTTYPQYQALSVQIGKQHPGYYAAMLGDDYAVERYLWGSGCPTNDLVGPNKVLIDLNAPSCTRVETMLDALIAAKVASPVGIFDTDAAKIGAKLVMTPGAAWYGVYLFEDTFKVPAGQITATVPLSWPGTVAGTGDEGGGLWSMSSHISGQRQADTATFMEFMASEPGVAGGPHDRLAGLPSRRRSLDCEEHRQLALLRRRQPDRPSDAEGGRRDPSQPRVPPVRRGRPVDRHRYSGARSRQADKRGVVCVPEPTRQQRQAERLHRRDELVPDSGLG